MVKAEHWWQRMGNVRGREVCGRLVRWVGEGGIGTTVTEMRWVVREWWVAREEGRWQGGVTTGQQQKLGTGTQ